MAKLFRITDKPINPQELHDFVSTEQNGGIVVFTGTVRRWNEGQMVHWLEYEAYQDAAEEVMANIARQIEERWGITDVAMAHRVGRLEVGEVAVVVAIGAPHRGEAFDACEFGIDTLKATAPIWKKESWESDEGTRSERWVENKVQE
jgi:molybdopterin synthase catalytic subunit